MSTVTFNSVVAHRVDVSPNLAIFRVMPDGWELPDFIPGQFAALGLPPGAARVEGADTGEETGGTGALIKRAYSIASSSVAKEYVEFYVALVPSGALTPRLFALQPGDKLWMSLKFKGMFTLDHVPTDQNIVFVATGTGIAPYMSMLRTNLDAAGNRKFAVLHGARHTWDLGYRDELLALVKTHGNFAYSAIISEPEDEKDDWKGPTGFLQDYWRGRPLDKAWGIRPAPEHTHVFLCGNPLMIQNMLVVLDDDGFREHTRKLPGQIHMEKYW